MARKIPNNLSLHYSGGWHEPLSGKYIPTFDPSTGMELARVACAGVRDVERAVAGADEGYRVWRNSSSLERRDALFELGARLRYHREELAWLDAIDAGMPIREVERDIEIAATAVEFFAGLTTEAKGTTLPPASNELTYSIREPLGVVARVLAFNHPLMFAASRAAAPIAAGNALILKPSERSPLSTLRLAEIAEGIFPPGVLNVLPGDGECGKALASSPGIAKIALIGSVPTGVAIMRAAADTIKEIGLELGGKNALVAFPDSDPEAVAGAIFRGMNFSWCGQSCGSTSRAFLHTEIHDDVVRRLVKLSECLRPGRPTDRNTAMGCLISHSHRDHVARHVASAVAEGARIETGGRAPDDPELADGAFFLPTVLSGIDQSMSIANEETFGPVVSTLAWNDFDEMIRAVNATRYGLTASIWTQDIDAAQRTLAELEVGYVWINNVGTHIHGAPFGGRKLSGIGREESLEELLAYTAIKNVNLRFTA